mmetsp:Transcript_5977/g.14218  ORF Transcript_5977/g.14218 Transcript_5977/m.14218 type:complete len:229 (+) Transcript_5977:143-829(+)
MSIFAGFSAGKTVGASSTGGYSFGTASSIFVASTEGRSSTGGRSSSKSAAAAGFDHRNSGGGGIFGSTEQSQPAPPPLPPTNRRLSSQYEDVLARRNNSHEASKKAAPPKLEMTGNHTEDMKKLLEQLKGLEASSPTNGTQQRVSFNESDEAPDTAFDDLRETTMRLMKVMPNSPGQAAPASSPRPPVSSGPGYDAGKDDPATRQAEEAIRDQMRALSRAKQSGGGRE